MSDIESEKSPSDDGCSTWWTSYLADKNPDGNCQDNPCHYHRILTGCLFLDLPRYLERILGLNEIAIGPILNRVGIFWAKFSKLRDGHGPAISSSEILIGSLSCNKRGSESGTSSSRSCMDSLKVDISVKGPPDMFTVQREPIKMDGTTTTTT